MASGGINRFYKKMKKSDAMKKSAVSKISPKDTEEDEEVVKEQLRQFDLDMRYGPCIGMMRMERWNRANSMGLQPSAAVKDLLLRSAAGDEQAASAIPCVWDRRI